MKSNGEIAWQLGRDPSSTSREIRRNCGGEGYAHTEAKARAEGHEVNWVRFLYGG